MRRWTHELAEFKVANALDIDISRWPPLQPPHITAYGTLAHGGQRWLIELLKEH